jgi:hypothetical protein
MNLLDVADCRVDIQSIFDPIFAEILSLVQKQIKAVVETDNVKMKVSPILHTLTVRYYFWLADLGPTDI